MLQWRACEGCRNSISATARRTNLGKRQKSAPVEEQLRFVTEIDGPGNEWVGLPPWFKYGSLVVRRRSRKGGLDTVRGARITGVSCAELERVILGA